MKGEEVVSDAPPPPLPSARGPAVTLYSGIVAALVPLTLTVCVGGSGHDIASTRLHKGKPKGWPASTLLLSNRR